MSGLVNDYDLIKLVESFPILYDKDLARGTRNATMKDEAWKELSIKLQASERACITRWKSIRDRFGKEYRRVQENPDEPTNWDMFQHLLFLRNHYKHGNASTDAPLSIKYEPKERKRRTRNRLTGELSQGEDDSNNEDEIDQEEFETNQQLIALVKEHPVLYDKQKIRDSKNLTAKNDAWREISENLKISEEICYKRWKKLRDRCAREFRYQAISPEKPVTWPYFPDLLFLEGHYRKGVPLRVETLKRKGSAAAAIAAANAAAIVNQEENHWGDDYIMDCHKQEILEEETEEYGEIQEHAMDELIIIPAKKQATFVPATQQFHHHQQHHEQETLIHHKDTDISTSALVVADEPEEQLASVISNIETVLRQSHDCLKALQQQKQQHRQELEECSALGAPVEHPSGSMLQKVNLLLDNLEAEHRNKAERKILQFLCECQIKTLNNEDIEDVCGVQIY